MSLSPHAQLSARRHQDGRRRDGRHHDQGRPVRRLQRLSHGHHRRECGREISDHPRRAGRLRHRLAEQGRGGAQSGRFKDEIVPVTVKTRKGDTSSTTTNSRATAHGRDAGRAAPGLQQGRHRHRRQCLGPQRRRRRARADERDEAEKRGIAARPDRVVGLRRRRSVDHGHRPGSGLAGGAREGRLDDRRPRPDRGQRGVRRAGAGGRQGARLGSRQLNVNGGAIAIGHPIGASGARVLTTLLYEMQKRDAKKGLATLCIGGGMGIAICVERD